MNVIAQAWKSYRELVIPGGADEVQISETRQAFYAGAAILFQTLMFALDPGTEPTADDMQRMADLQAELDAFGQEIDRKILNLPQH